MQRPTPQVSIVVPCFNEEAVLPDSIPRLLALLSELIEQGRATASSGLYFVDDGSADATWATITQWAESHPACHGIKLSRNHGHQNALLAGLLTVPGDAVISIDADLQDDPGVMGAMLDAYGAGAEIVYGVRRARDCDTAFKRVTAQGYYRLLGALHVPVVFNHADYRLLGRRALEALKEFREVNLFLRGLIPHLGFNSATVYYDRSQRRAGESKYPLRKMLRLAADGITSFSAVPLTLITLLGLAVALVSFVIALWAVWVRIFNSAAVPGWASTVVPLYFLGGIQLLSTGIIGQYLAKTYLETKARPRFIIDRTV